MKRKTSLYGLIVSLLMSYPAAVHAQKVEWELSQAYLESIARFAAEYVKAARNEDHDRVLRLSCLQLDIAIEYLNPNTYENEAKKSEVAALKESSVQLHQELKAQGYCE